MYLDGLPQIWKKSAIYYSIIFTPQTAAAELRFWNTFLGRSQVRDLGQN